MRKIDTQLSPQYNKILDKRLSVADAITRDSLMSRYWGMRVHLEDTNVRRVLQKNLVDSNLYNNANWILEEDLFGFKFAVTEDFGDTAMTPSRHSRQNGTVPQIVTLPTADLSNKGKLFSVKKTTTNGMPAAIKSNTQKIDGIEPSAYFTQNKLVNLTPERAITGTPYGMCVLKGWIITCGYERLVAVNEETGVRVSDAGQVGPSLYNYGVATDGEFLYISEIFSKAVRKYAFNATTGAFTFISSLVVGANGASRIYHIRGFILVLAYSPYVWRRISTQTFTVSNTSGTMPDRPYEIIECAGSYYACTANSGVIHKFNAAMSITATLNVGEGQLRSLTSNNVNTIRVSNLALGKMISIDVATFAKVAVNTDAANTCAIGIEYYPRTGLIYGTSGQGARSVGVFNPVSMTRLAIAGTQPSYYDLYAFIKNDKMYSTLYPSTGVSPKILVTNIYDKYPIELYNENEDAFFLSNGAGYDTVSVNYKKISRFNDAFWKGTSTSATPVNLQYKGSPVANFILDWDENIVGALYIKGYDRSNGDMASYRFDITMNNVEGKHFLTSTKNIQFESTAAFDANIAVSDLTGIFSISVTGTIGRVMDWTASGIGI